MSARTRDSTTSRCRIAGSAGPRTATPEMESAASAIRVRKIARCGASKRAAAPPNALRRLQRGRARSGSGPSRSNLDVSPENGRSSSRRIEAMRTLARTSSEAMSSTSFRPNPCRFYLSGRAIRVPHMGDCDENPGTSRSSAASAFRLEYRTLSGESRPGERRMRRGSGAVAKAGQRLLLRLASAPDAHGLQIGLKSIGRLGSCSRPQLEQLTRTRRTEEGGFPAMGCSIGRSAGRHDPMLQSGPLRRPGLPAVGSRASRAGRKHAEPQRSGCRRTARTAPAPRRGAGGFGPAPARLAQALLWKR